MGPNISESIRVIFSWRKKSTPPCESLMIPAPAARRPEPIRTAGASTQARIHACISAGIHKRRRPHPQQLAQGILPRLFGNGRVQPLDSLAHAPPAPPLKTNPAPPPVRRARDAARVCLYRIVPRTFRGRCFRWWIGSGSCKWSKVWEPSQVRVKLSHSCRRLLHGTVEKTTLERPPSTTSPCFAL